MESLRDRIAAVLGPGSDDATAYAQADAVLQTIWENGFLIVPHAGEGLGWREEPRGMDSGRWPLLALYDTADAEPHYWVRENRQ